MLRFLLAGLLLVAPINAAKAQSQSAVRVDLSEIDGVLINDQQYWADVTCGTKNRLNSRTAAEYMSRINSRGEIERLPNSFNLRFRATEILEGFIILPSRPTFTETSFRAGQAVLPSGTVFVPTLHIRRGPRALISAPPELTQLDDSLCDTNFFILGSDEYYVIPFFMYSNEQDGKVTDLINKILQVARDVAGPFQAIAGGLVDLGDGFDPALDNTQAIVRELGELLTGPRFRMELGDPVRLDLGRTRIESETRVVDIDISSDPSFLRGGSPFRNAFDTVFRPLLNAENGTTNDYSTEDKAGETCNRHDVDLRGRGFDGVQARFDRAYILFRHLYELNVPRRTIIRCLLSSRSYELAYAASLENAKFRSIFYPEGVQPIESVEIETYLATTPVPNLDESPILELTPSVLELEIREIADIHRAFTTAVSSAQTRDGLSSLGRRAERLYFLPRINLHELNPGSIFTREGSQITSEDNEDSDTSSRSGSPYEVFREMYDAGFDRTACLLNSQSLTSFSRPSIMGTSELGFLFVNSAEVGDDRRVTSNNSVLARINYGVVGSGFIISSLDLLSDPPPATFSAIECVDFVATNASS